MTSYLYDNKHQLFERLPGQLKRKRLRFCLGAYNGNLDKNADSVQIFAIGGINLMTNEMINQIESYNLVDYNWNIEGSIIH